jgi:hypothetical protein
MIARAASFVTSAWWVSSFPARDPAGRPRLQPARDWLRDTLDPKLRQL